MLAYYSQNSISSGSNRIEILMKCPLSLIKELLIYTHLEMSYDVITEKDKVTDCLLALLE